MIRNTILFNPFLPEFHLNPYPTFARLQQEDPIHKSMFNTWIITRYADAEAILKDRRFQVDNLPERLKDKNRYLKEGDLNAISQTIDKWLFFLEYPDHSRLKGILTPTFSQAAIESLCPEIESMVEDLLAQFKPIGSMEIIEDLITPLAARVIVKMLGLPIEDCEQLIKWSAKSIFIFDQPMSLERYQEQNQIIIENRQYLLEKIAEYKRQPNNGLISYLANPQDKNHPLSDEEIASICILLSATAQESTKGLVGNGILALLKHSQSLEYVRQNPDDIKNIVEELLRYDSPIQYVSRRAIEDVEIAERVIRRGEYVIIYIGAVNRDPAHFPHPDQLDFTRRKRNLAFGSGIHYCLGMYLAKVEGQIVINTLIKNLSNLQINTENLVWFESNISRRLKSLPLKFTPIF